jgi:hypothetical protein
MDDDESDSSYLRMKQRVNKKLDNVKGNMLKEIREELQEHDDHLQDAKDVALGKEELPVPVARYTVLRILT